MNILLTSGPFGKEFYLLFLENVGDNYRSGSIYLDQLEVLVSTRSQGWVVLEAPEVNILENRTITNSGTVFILPHSLRLTNDTRVERKGVHVYSSVNISVYAYDSKVSTREGYYVLPSHHLSTEYIAMSYTPGNHWKSLVGIVATADHTIVNVTLNTSGTVYYQGSAFGNGDKITIYLDKLHTYQVNGHHDLTGSKLESNHPVVVVSGDQCALNTDYDTCQPLYEQMIPPKTWGTHFLIPPLNLTLTYYELRVFANQNDTMIQIQGNHFAPKNFSVNLSSFTEFNFTKNDTITITANKPVFVYVVITSAMISRFYTGFAMTIPALSHFSSEYAFHVPDDHNFGQYYAFISVIVKSTSIRYTVLDGQTIQSNANNTRTTNIASDNYSEVTLMVKSGTHKLLNTRGYKMGLLVYGYTRELYCWGYGYPGGLSLT